MNRHARKFKTLLTLLLLAALLLSACPAALAESYSAFATQDGAGLYADAALQSCVDTLDKYAVVVVLKEAGGVARVQYHGSTRYMKSNALRAVEDEAEPAVVNQSATAYEALDPDAKTVTLSKGTKVNLIAAQGGWAAIEKDGVGAFVKEKYLTVTSASAQTASASSEKALSDLLKNARDGYFKCDSYIYKKADASSDRVSVSEGTQVRVLKVDGDWALIERNGAYAYAYIADLREGTSAQTTTAPTATPAPEQDYSALLASAKDGYANTDTYAFREPSTSSSRTHIAEGTAVKVLSIDGDWALVEKDGAYGYMLTAHVSKSAPAATVAPEATAAAPDYSALLAGAKDGEITAATRVYETASTSASSVRVSKGTKVKILKVSGDWTLVSKDGVYAFVKSSEVAEVSKNDASDGDSDDYSALLANAKTAYVSADARVYRAANTSSASLKVSKGMKVKLLAVSGEWALVESNGVYAYMKADVLTMNAQTGQADDSVDYSALLANAKDAQITVDTRAYAAADASSQSVKVSKGMKVKLLKVSGGWALVESGGKYAYVDAEKVAEIAQQGDDSKADYSDLLANAKEAVINTATRVYQSASTSSASVKVSKGLRVRLLTIDGDWALVEYNGTYAFMNADHVSLAAVTPSYSEDHVIAAIATKTTDVYAAPSTHSEYVAKLSAGAQVKVLKISDGWAYISKGSAFGWCAVSALTPDTSADDDPFSGYINEAFTATVVASGAQFYSEPSTSAQHRTVPVGVNVKVGAYSAEGWAYVDVAGVKGYMKIADLSRTEYAQLSVGSTGSAVSTLCKALLSLGYFDTEPTQTYDSYTEAAVKLFQNDVGLTPTGKADEITQRVLYSGNASFCSQLSALSRGDSGTAVKRVQLRLYTLGYLSKSSSVDGSYGGNTYNAVKMFQSCHGLTADGAADMTTLKKLYSTAAVKLPSGKVPGDVSSYVEPSAGNQQNNAASISTSLASTMSSLPSDATSAEKLEYVIYMGQNQLGKPYIYATSGPNSYDCTGFTCYCFKQIGVSLERSAYNQGYANTYTKISSISELRRGDLVYFDTVADSDLSDHAGIYLGAGYFIHASSGQGKVVVSNLASGYYNRVFSWGRRVFN